MTGPLQKEPDILAFETANATPAEVAPSILSTVHATSFKNATFSSS
jgi:hypothetical protein